jgi:antitoxin ChpS
VCIKERATKKDFIGFAVLSIPFLPCATSVDVLQFFPAYPRRCGSLGVGVDQTLRAYYTPVKYGDIMLTAALRRSGGSLIMTIPQAYVEQNMLKAGSLVSVEIAGEELRLKPAVERKSLAALLAATSDGLHRADGWDDMSQAGVEL